MAKSRVLRMLKCDKINFSGICFKKNGIFCDPVLLKLFNSLRKSMSGKFLCFVRRGGGGEGQNLANMSGIFSV